MIHTGGETLLQKRRQKAEDAARERAEDLERKLGQRLDEARDSKDRKPVPKLTKKEVSFLLVQILYQLGGQDRLDKFLADRGWQKNSPRNIRGKIRYTINKLLNDLPEADLHDCILEESARSYLYSAKPLKPMFFDRSKQKAMEVIEN